MMTMIRNIDTIDNIDALDDLDALELYKNEFMYACVNGDLIKCKLLKFENKSINISGYYETILQTMFDCGNLHIIKWLIEIIPNITINYNKAFFDACEDGHLEVIKWLFEIKPTIDISYNNYKALYNAFYWGELEVVKWIFHKIPINDIFYNDQIFYKACEDGHFELTKWLVEINPNINESVNLDEAFCIACSNGCLEIAKFLLELKPTIETFANDNESFKNACDNGYLAVAEWLVSIDNRYIITNSVLDINVDVDNSNIGYIITYTIMNRFMMHNDVIKYVNEIEICVICKENDNDIQTNCNHNFCTSCITTWAIYNKSCPYCRENINSFCKIAKIDSIDIIEHEDK